HPALAEISRRQEVGVVSEAAARAAEALAFELVLSHPVDAQPDAPMLLLFAPGPPARLLTLQGVAPVVALAGWRPLILVPPANAELVASVARHLGARAIGISAERPRELHEVDRAIPLLQRELPGVPIIVGRAASFLGFEWEPPAGVTVVRS